MPRATPALGGLIHKRKGTDKEGASLPRSSQDQDCPWGPGSKQEKEAEALGPCLFALQGILPNRNGLLLFLKAALILRSVGSQRGTSPTIPSQATALAE